MQVVIAFNGSCFTGEYTGVKGGGSEASCKREDSTKGDADRNP
jgi:hypothetical protein